MKEKLPPVEAEIGPSAWGGHVQVSWMLDDASGEAEISVDGQVFSDDGREEAATLKFTIDQDLTMRPPRFELSTGAVYAACVVASVGAQVWNDYVECKKQAKIANPNGTWRQIHSDAWNCIKQKHPGMVKSLRKALVSCTPTFLG